MAGTAADRPFEALYRGRAGTVEFVDVPELGFVVIDGVGAPEGRAFADAIQALYTASYGAHFAVKKATGNAPRVMALEALWWVEGADASAAMEQIATADARMTESDHAAWRWRAMIAQLAPIDAAVVDAVVATAKAGKALPALDLLRYERWREGRCAQIMHIGPYSTEQASIHILHRAIADAGQRPRGHHHEIYLGDPRRCAPERLRTLLRQPVEPDKVGAGRRPGTRRAESVRR
jgi:hypothetical protein